MHRLLIANRGEVACRIARSAHDLGLETIAIASSIERGARHVRVCDHAVEIGAAAAAESYLSIERILAAAKATSADAIHPGYGFLAENAEFARAVTDAGLVFVGPSAEVIETLASKRRAAEIASAVGIDPVPRHDGQTTPTTFPVMVKAADGGGGKGMAIVREASEFAPAVESAKRVALASFGSDDVIVEDYIEGARHIEVQILADSHGHVVHLGERECSIQRRHQKIIEEAPANSLDAAIREQMTTSAVLLAKQVGYESAGTVEMILAPDGRFFFLEVNTRLQVEHAVTEMTTGVDIVAEQLRIARGESMSFAQADVEHRGVAIEARLYAEDTASGDLPATGTIAKLFEPSGGNVRIDSGLAVGQIVGIDYDPLLAKIIAHGETRAQARGRLRRALIELRVSGVATNRGPLIKALESDAFASGAIDTSFWATHHAELIASHDNGSDRAAIAATLASVIRRHDSRAVYPGVLPGFRLGGPREAIDTLIVHGESQSISYTSLGADRFRVLSGGEINEIVTATVDGDSITLWSGTGVRTRYDVLECDDRIFVHADSDWIFGRPARFAIASDHANVGDCAAPMPGRVSAVHTAVGQSVSRGETLVVLEAMKMEHPVRAPHDGEVTEISAAPGDQVSADQVLVVVRATE